MVTSSASASEGSERPNTDVAFLDRLKRFGGGTLLNEMISLYISTAPERLAAARDGLASGDADATERALHSLKSSSAQLGALHMQRLSEEGEQCAKDGSFERVARLVQDLEEEFPRVQSWLERARTMEKG